MSPETAVHREWVKDGFGGYLEEWMCAPPVDTGFRVVSEEWFDDFTRRVIWEWEPVG